METTSGLESDHAGNVDASSCAPAQRSAVAWGAGLALCLIALTLLYLQVPASFPQPAGWSPRPNHSVEVSALYRRTLHVPPVAIPMTAFRWLNLLLILLSFGCYLGAVRRAAGARWNRSLSALTGVLVLAAVLMPPLYATDIFYYAVEGQIAGPYGANPYVRPPADFVGNALWRYNYWTDVTAPYGPLWMLLSAGLGFITGPDPFLATVAFKITAAAFWACSVWAILTVNSQRHPSQPLQAPLLFAWSPFVLLESAGNGHSDIAMAALSVAAVLLLLRGRSLSGFVVLVGAAMTKYLVAPVVGLYLAAQLCQGKRGNRARAAQLLVYLLAGTLAIMFSFAPYWSGPRIFASVLEESSRGTSGPVALIVKELLLASGASVRATVAAVRLATALGLLLVSAWWLQRIIFLWKTGRETDLASQVGDWAFLLTVLPLVMPFSHPWFLLTAVALWSVVLREKSRVAVAAYLVTSVWFVLRFTWW